VPRIAVSSSFHRASGLKSGRPAGDGGRVARGGRDLGGPRRWRVGRSRWGGPGAGRER
jgi:hypothetical protein